MPATLPRTTSRPTHDQRAFDREVEAVAAALRRAVAKSQRDDVAGRLCIALRRLQTLLGGRRDGVPSPDHARRLIAALKVAAAGAKARLPDYPARQIDVGIESAQAHVTASAGLDPRAAWCGAWLGTRLLINDLDNRHVNEIMRRRHATAHEARRRARPELAERFGHLPPTDVPAWRSVEPERYFAQRGLEIVEARR